MRKIHTQMNRVLITNTYASALFLSVKLFVGKIHITVYLEDEYGEFMDVQAKTMYNQSHPRATKADKYVLSLVASFIECGRSMFNARENVNNF